LLKATRTVILKLISFKLCPFVQRALIVLRYKGVEHEIAYVDLDNPPEWLLNLSTLKKVPLLLVSDHVIFESTVINEYLDEAYANKLHPEDLILRAKNRNCIEFCNGCMWDVFHLSVKESEREYLEIVDGLLNKFDYVEETVIASPFFNGAAFSLVDASYAPMFQRLAYINVLKEGVFNPSRHPNITTWKDELLEHDSVRESTVPEFKDLYYKLLWKRRGYISRFLDPKYRSDVKKSTY
jgi:glutathione S-transferase